MRTTYSLFGVVAVAAEWQLQAHYVGSVQSYILEISNALGMPIPAMPWFAVPDWVVPLSAIIAVIAGLVHLSIAVTHSVMAVFNGARRFTSWLRDKWRGQR